MVKTIVFAPLMLALLAATGCSGTPQPAAGGKVSNSELFQQVKTSLNSDPAVAALKLSVDTNAESNEVTLSGTVNSEDLRVKAVSLARTARPGLSVKDAITVTAPPAISKPEPKPQARKSASKAKVQPKKKPARRRR